MFNYTKDVTLHAHLHRCEPYLQKRLQIPNIFLVDWSLRRDIINKIPKHLHIQINKSLLHFAGTSHQLDRQKLCYYNVCRCCFKDPDIDTLHVVDFIQDLFSTFKRDLFSQLQTKVMMLTEEDLTPLLLLESMLQSVFLPLTDISHHNNEDLRQVGRRHSWHGFFPKSFTHWVTHKYREKEWITKFSAF